LTSAPILGSRRNMISAGKPFCPLSEVVHHWADRTRAPPGRVRRPSLPAQFRDLARTCMEMVLEVEWEEVKITTSNASRTSKNMSGLAVAADRESSWSSAAANRADLTLTGRTQRLLSAAFISRFGLMHTPATARLGRARPYERSRLLKLYRLRQYRARHELGSQCPITTSGATPSRAQKEGTGFGIRTSRLRTDALAKGGRQAVPPAFAVITTSRRKRLRPTPSSANGRGIRSKSRELHRGCSTKRNATTWSVLT
jgi:hypothetical protein